MTDKATLIEYLKSRIEIEKRQMRGLPRDGYWHGYHEGKLQQTKDVLQLLGVKLNESTDGSPIGEITIVPDVKFEKQEPPVTITNQYLVDQLAS